MPLSWSEQHSKDGDNLKCVQ